MKTLMKKKSNERNGSDQDDRWLAHLFQIKERSITQFAAIRYLFIRVRTNRRPSRWFCFSLISRTFFSVFSLWPIFRNLPSKIKLTPSLVASVIICWPLPKLIPFEPDWINWICCPFDPFRIWLPDKVTNCNGWPCIAYWVLLPSWLLENKF